MQRCTQMMIRQLQRQDFLPDGLANGGVGNRRARTNPPSLVLPRRRLIEPRIKLLFINEATRRQCTADDPRALLPRDQRKQLTLFASRKGNKRIRVACVCSSTPHIDKEMKKRARTIQGGCAHGLRNCLEDLAVVFSSDMSWQESARLSDCRQKTLKNRVFLLRSHMGQCSVNITSGVEFSFAYSSKEMRPNDCSGDRFFDT